VNFYHYRKDAVDKAAQSNLETFQSICDTYSRGQIAYVGKMESPFSVTDFYYLSDGKCYVINNDLMFPRNVILENIRVW
jgi:hypothetical protein